jgi:hypothetical protein
MATSVRSADVIQNQRNSKAETFLYFLPKSSILKPIRVRMAGNEHS